MSPSTGSVTLTSNVSAILKKLDAESLAGPEKRAIFKEAGTQGLAYLRPITPHLTGASEAKEAVQITDVSAKITAPNHPLIFLERGSQAHIGPGSRQHRRKSAKAFRSGMLRIEGRHFLRKTRLFTRKLVTDTLIPNAVKGIEARWAQ